ncbi:MAG: flagellar FliJ family protein [Buchnera aphidicola (Nurudea yanoniella)]
MNKNKIQEQINLLSKYKKEYLFKLHSEMHCGIFGFELRNYDYFIHSLTNDIEKQKKTIREYDKQYDIYFNLWKRHQCRLKMWSIISAKLSNYNFQITQLEEQIQLDEYVQRSFFKKGNSLISCRTL